VNTNTSDFELFSGPSLFDHLPKSRRQNDDGVAVPETPTLLMLHGVGAGDPDHSWQGTLNRSLLALGYPGLGAVQVIAPQYAHALKGWDVEQTLPEVTIKQPGRDDARRHRRAFERRTGALEFRLGRHDHGEVWPGADLAMGMAIDLPTFGQARNYLTDLQIRAQVLRRILDSLPDTGEIVILGHSLGSVVAADLVRRLPPGLRVTGMVTIGSPLAHGRFDVDKLRDSMKEPPTNLSWWVNVWNTYDPVAAHRGVSSVFPWMLDFRIHTGAYLKQAHDALEYLADESVATAVGYAVFGSPSKEVARLESGLDIPLDAAERTAVTALRYAHLAKARLAGDQKERFIGALRHVQAAAVKEIRVRNHLAGRPIPSAVARLAFDLSDPDAEVPEPLPSTHLDKEAAVGLFTALASENVIRPFEIVLPKNAWHEAMTDLSAEMALGSQFGRDVFRATDEARDVLTRSDRLDWKKWGAIGAGAAALIAVTGGLALAAGVGLAGAAAMTTALAGFGPGGMIGGLITAGALASAGGGGIAYGLASSDTTAETLGVVVERRLASAILRKEQRLEMDASAWTFFTQIEIEIRREHERLDEFSDASAPTLRELARKIETVERALRYMREHALEPGSAGTI